MPAPVRPATPAARPPVPATPKPSAPDPAAADPRSRELQPTAIMGKSPERLSVGAADLRRLSPQAAKPVLDAGLALLAGVVPDKLSERKAVLWGHDLQKRHAETVSKGLDLSRAPVMRRMQGHVARLLEILEGFDLAGAAAPEGRGLGGFLKALGRRTDTAAEFEAAGAELEQLVRLLNDSLEELLSLRQAMQTNAAKQNAMAAEVEAAALAALYLSEHFRAAGPALSERFLERGMSLTQTLAQIRAHDDLRAFQLEQPMRTIAAIQNVTLVSMPDFLASLAAIGSARDATLPTPTQSSELRFKLTHIVEQLKS